MKKRALSVLLCAALTLSLAACGGGQTGSSTTEPPAESTSSGHQATEPSKEPERTQPEETEPAETQPEETEPEETTPTETEPAETAPAETEPMETTPAETEPEETQPTETAPEASAFLALLQAEYQSDTALGLTGQHSFPVFTSPKNQSYTLFDFGDTLYFFCRYDRTWFAYDLATKTQTQLTGPDMVKNDLLFFLDGAVYYTYGNTISRDDLHGNTVNISKEYGDYSNMLYYGGGILYYPFDLSKDIYLYTVDLQKIASIPAPRQEAAHGLTETVPLEVRTLCATGGKIYATDYNNAHLYSLDPTAAAPEWTDLGEFFAQPETFQQFVLSGGAGFYSFLGRYYYSNNDRDRYFYDMTTGETVFELGELYAPVGGKSYFGGDSYIGYKGNYTDREYRMVNLANGTMSDPLTLPEKYNGLYFLNDTYCVYSDQYGIFLWNYLTGEETTIVMYEQN